MIDKIVVEYKDNIKKVACLCEGKLREFFLLDNNKANEILNKVNSVLQNSSFISLQNYHVLSQCFFDLSKVTNNSEIIDKQNYLKALVYQKQLLDKMILFVSKLITEYN